MASPGPSAGIRGSRPAPRRAVLSAIPGRRPAGVVEWCVVADGRRAPPGPCDREGAGAGGRAPPQPGCPSSGRPERGLRFPSGPGRVRSTPRSPRCPWAPAAAPGHRSPACRPPGSVRGDADGARCGGRAAMQCPTRAAGRRSVQDPRHGQGGPRRGTAVPGPRTPARRHPRRACRSPDARHAGPTGGGPTPVAPGGTQARAPATSGGHRPFSLLSPPTCASDRTRRTRCVLY